MQKTLNAKSIQNFIFFITVWIFFSLNSRYLKIPNDVILRWVFLGILILLSVFINGSIQMEVPKILIIFIVAVLPSVMVSIRFSESLEKFMSFIVVVWGSYIFFNNLETKAELETALKIILFIIIAFEIQSLVVMALGLNYDGNRAKGITTNPNTLGVYSNLALIASYFWMKRCTGFKKLFFLILMGLSVYSALASGSRTAFATLCVIIAILILIKTQQGAGGVVLVILFSLVVYLTLSGNLKFLNFEVINRLNFNEDTRSLLWEKGIQVWRDHPIFGCGYAVSEYLNDLDSEVGFYAFHNSYISYLAETGLWGVLLLGIEIVLTLIKVIKTITKKQHTCLLIAFLLMLCLLICAFGESFLFAVGSTEACTFWLLITWGLVYVDKVNSSEQNIATNRERV